jgi:hypothetical protein
MAIVVHYFSGIGGLAEKGNRFLTTGIYIFVISEDFSVLFELNRSSFGSILNLEFELD